MDQAIDDERNLDRGIFIDFFTRKMPDLTCEICGSKDWWPLNDFAQYMSIGLSSVNVPGVPNTVRAYVISCTNCANTKIFPFGIINQINKTEVERETNDGGDSSAS